MRKQLLVSKRKSMNSPRPTCDSISFPPLSCSVPSPPPSASGRRIRCTGTLPNTKDSRGSPSSSSYDRHRRRRRSPSPPPPPPPCGSLAPRFVRSTRSEIKNYLCSMLRYGRYAPSLRHCLCGGGLKKDQPTDFSDDRL
jgi:hypothetical protein